jgi:hypothetical protein
MEDFHHAQVGVCCTAALLLLLVLVPSILQPVCCDVNHLPACLQFKTEPVSGESVGLFGVFDGKQMASTVSRRSTWQLQHSKCSASSMC